MQDLHALRKGRQELVESGADPYCVLAHRPPASSDALLRELGAIQRSDLTLVCSPVELELLKGVYGVSPSKLCQASFFCQEAGRDTAAGDYGERAPGVEVGGTDAVAGGAGTPAQASFFCQEAARDAAGDYGASEPGVGVGRTDTAAKDEGAPTTSVAERDDKPTYGERAALVEVGVTDAAAKRAHTSTASIGGSKDPSTAAVAGAIDGQLVDTTQLPPDTPELTPLPRSDQPSAGSDVPPGLGSPLEQASAGPGASPGVGFGYSPRHGFDSRRGFVTIGGFCHVRNICFVGPHLVLALVTPLPPQLCLTYLTSRWPSATLTALSSPLTTGAKCGRGQVSRRRDLAAHPRPAATFTPRLRHYAPLPPLYLSFLSPPSALTCF